MLDPAEFARRHPVECVIVAKRRWPFRRVYAVATVRARYGAPAFECLMDLKVKPGSVRVVRAVATTKTEKFVLTPDQSSSVIALPPIALAMEELKEMANGG